MFPLLRIGVFACLEITTLICAAATLAQAQSIRCEDPTLNGQTVTAIAMSGANQIRADELLSPGPLQPDMPYSTEACRRSQELLVERGLFARVECSAQRNKHGIAITFGVTPLITLSRVEFSGNTEVLTQRLRRVTGLQLGRPVDQAGLERATRQIREAYAKAGFYNPIISVSVNEVSRAPAIIVRFSIDEGYQSIVRELQMPDELPPRLEPLRSDFESTAIGEVASDTNLRRLRLRFLRSVRVSGYLQASVDLVDRGFIEKSRDRRLELRLKAREPMSIELVGNQALSRSELLRPLRLNRRLVPYSGYAIQNLCRQIESLYQAIGYFFAKATATLVEGPDGQQIYKIAIVEAERYSLRRISFEGNQVLSTRALREVVGSQSAQPLLGRWSQDRFLITEQVEADTDALRALYQIKGFPSARVIPVVSQVFGEQQLNLKFIIEEGLPTIIESVLVRWKDYESLLASDPAEFSKLMAQVVSLLPSVGLMDRELIATERSRLLDELLDRGYPNATVKFQRNEQLGRVRFVMRPGPRILVGRIILQGNLGTRDHVLNRELELQPGEVWNARALDATKRNLSGLGLFRSVETKPHDGVLDGPKEDLEVQVLERDTGSVTSRIRLDSEDGINLAGELQQRNVAGMGDRFLLGVDVFSRPGGGSNSNQAISASNARALFTQRRIFDSSVDAVFEGFAASTLRILRQYAYDRYGGAAKLRYPFSERVHVNGGFVVFREIISDVLPGVAIGADDEGSNHYGMFTGDIDFDYRDDPFNPRSGWRFTTALRYSPGNLGSSVEFGDASAQASYYSELSSDLVLATSVRGQFAEPFGSSSVIPVSQRIFLGGRNSLRGFSRFAVGPRASTLAVVGSDRAIVSNTELQYALNDSLVGVTFLDVGQAWLSNEGAFLPASPDGEKLRFSPGFGIRYRTPIGPLGVDYGFALDREFGERLGRLSFGIGGTF